MPTQSWIFNETSPSSAITTVSSQVVQGSASWAPPGVAAGGIDDYEALLVAADLQGATGGQLDVVLETSPDAGLSWYPIVHFALLAAAAAARHDLAMLSLFSSATAPVTVGSGTTVVLGSGVIVPGPWADRLRLVMIAGASTSAGAPVVVKICGSHPRLREAGGGA